MSQRFGSPSGKADSGTEEEFNWAMECHKDRGFPEIKWFFRKIDKLELPANLDEAEMALAQWRKVQAFRKRMQDLKDPVFYTEYPGANGFSEVFEKDLNQWLAAPARPWRAEMAGQTAARAAVAITLPAEFDAERYHEALLKRFDKLNFEMLDTTGVHYSGVRLWSVFVPQSVRECNQYNPRLLEIPKEHQQRLLKSGEISDEELKEAEEQADRLRQEYFSQPLRPVLDVIDAGLQTRGGGNAQKLVILGDPGSGKSALIHYLALRWARIAEPSVRETQPIPLVIDLGKYARWECDGRKGFVRFLEEAPVWHDWSRGLLNRLLGDAGRVVLLLDGLDEIFDVKTREGVVNDIQRFSSEFPLAPVLMTSRVVGYQAQALRDAEFRHFMLQDLDAVQINDFINRWHAETFENEEQAAPKRERLRRAIRDSKSIAMLAGNPLLLTMMAILNRNQELPRDRADLYAQASRVLLHQWDTERALVDFPGIRSDIGLREKTEMLRRVAAHMQTDPGGLKGNLVDGATLTGLIGAYLSEELHFDQGRAAAGTLVDQLRLRNFIVCFVGADSYAFVHRTFLEYFCAADIVHRFNVSKSLSEDGLIALFKEHCGQDEWREVLRLICGQIGEQVVATIVDSLLDEVDVGAWNGHGYLYELGLALAVMTEVRNPSALGNVATRLLDLLLLVLARAGGPSQTESMTKQMEEIADAAEVIGPRWPGLKERLPLETPVFGWAGSGGMRVWPRVVVAFESADRKSGLREFTLNGSEPGLRVGAMKALAEKWPDESTRDLLTQRAVHDDSAFPRRVALEALAEKWADESTRALLMQRAVEDHDWQPRQSALEALAEKWPDESTRTVLTHRGVDDDDEDARITALVALAHNWPDESTRTFLARKVVEDPTPVARGAACRSLATLHSEFGRILWTRDLDGLSPFLDPLKPIPRAQIEKAAAKAQIRIDDIDAAVKSLSTYLGWDVSRGAKAVRLKNSKGKRARNDRKTKK
jgi:GTPase SAR1 family protein